MANNTYLDEDGLSYLWGKISAALNLKANLASPTFTGTPKAPTAAATVNNTQIATTAFANRAVTNGISGITNEQLGHAYGTCDTTALAKIVTCTGYVLKKGSYITILFSSDVYSGSTLNINSTGALPIYFKGSALSETAIHANSAATFQNVENTYYNLISVNKLPVQYSAKTLTDGVTTTSYGYQDTISSPWFENDVGVSGVINSTSAPSAMLDFYPYSASTVNDLLADKADAGQVLKSCVIGQPNTLSADNWFKVTEMTITNTAADRDLIFLVSALYPGSGEDYGRKSGILRLHVRTGSTAMSATSPQNNLTWLSNMGFDPSDFAIAFNTDGLPATVQLWVKIEKVYQRYSFTLLKESSRTGMISSTVLNSTTTGSAAPTSGYTIVYSTNEYAADHLYLAECDTAADTAAKVVTVDDVRFALTKGVEIYVKFTNSNSASNVTLNVNGTGALPIWYAASEYTGASTTVCGYAARYLKYVYNGTHWVWAGHSTDLNTTYTNMSQTEANTGTATTARSISAKVLDTKIKNVLDSYYQYESASYTYSLAAGAVYSGTVSSAVANTIFALAGFNSGNNNVVFTNIRKYDSDGDIHYTIRNVGTSAVSNATLYISFITKAS